MRHLLNTLYILSEDIYLSLDGENVVANRDRHRCPLSSAYLAEYHHIFLLWGLACPDGRLRGASDRADLLHSQRKISGKGVRRKQRKYAAPADPIPCCG